MVFNGSFTMSSVGKATVDKEACRWIEFRMALKTNGQERIIRLKSLVPEKQLAGGKTPASHVKKLWFKVGDADAKVVSDLTDNSAGPLPGFLAGPFGDAKKLKAVPVESGLDKLDYKGVTGSTKFNQGSQKFKMTFTNRLHDKAPFGVVTSKIEIDVTAANRLTRAASCRVA